MARPFSRTLRRIRWRAAAVLAVCLAAAFGLGVMGYLGACVQVAFWLALVPSFVAYLLPRGRLRTRLVASGFRLCPDCEQSLAGLPDEGCCPECGRAFDVWEDRKGWACERLVQPSDLDVLD